MKVLERVVHSINGLPRFFPSAGGMNGIVFISSAG
jgi:hypothetical protein